MSTEQTSFYSGSYYMDEANQKLDQEMQTMDSLPNAFAQILYMMFEIMPTMEQATEGKMEYQDYLMDEMANVEVPALDNIKNVYNDSQFNPNESLSDVQGAIESANAILYDLYVNPNLSGDTELQSNVLASFNSLFNGDTYTKENFTVTINGASQTIEVPQFGTSEADGTDQVQQVLNYWSGYDAGTGEVSPGDSEYEEYMQGEQQWGNDLNSLSTDFTDFSSTAQSLFGFYKGEDKQWLAIWDDMLKDISKGEQQAINNLTPN